MMKKYPLLLPTSRARPVSLSAPSARSRGCSAYRPHRAGTPRLALRQFLANPERFLVLIAYGCFSFRSESTIPRLFSVRATWGRYSPVRSPPVCGKSPALLRTSRGRPASRSAPSARSRVVQRTGQIGPVHPRLALRQFASNLQRFPVLLARGPLRSRLRNPLRLHQIKSLARLVSEFSGQPHCSLTWPPESRRRERGF
jgi:hypothetical protein